STSSPCSRTHTSVGRSREGVKVKTAAWRAANTDCGEVFEAEPLIGHALAQDKPLRTRAAQRLSNSRPFEIWRKTHASALNRGYRFNVGGFGTGVGRPWRRRQRLR